MGINKHANENIDRIEQEMRSMLRLNWDDKPLRSKQFVTIVAHLLEIMRRSGFRADHTAEFVVQAMQEAQKLVDVKGLIL